MHGFRMLCESCQFHRAGICAVLDDDARARLYQMARWRSVAPRQVLFRDGDTVDYYFNIISGIVKLVKCFANGQQRIVGLVHSPGFLGQTLNARHSYSAESASAVELCSFPKAAFDAFIRSNYQLERKIYELTVRELDFCRDWTLLLGRKCSYQRVAGFLLMMARRVPENGRDGGRRVQFELPFTRAEMADYLGLSLETVSRQFSQLKKERLIALPSSREVVIPDIGLLGAAAQIESCSNAFDEGQGRAIA